MYLEFGLTFLDISQTLDKNVLILASGYVGRKERASHLFPFLHLH